MIRLMLRERPRTWSVMREKVAKLCQCFTVVKEKKKKLPLNHEPRILRPDIMNTFITQIESIRGDRMIK